MCLGCSGSLGFWGVVFLGFLDVLGWVLVFRILRVLNFSGSGFGILLRFFYF